MRITRTFSQALTTLAALMLAFQASAVITPFSDDFESYDETDPDAFGTDLNDAVYLVSAYVTGGMNGMDYGYGPLRAPNSTAAGTADGFSAIVTGNGGIDQLLKQLNVFSDYTNSDHGIPASNIESAFYKEYVIDASNVGETWSFSFDAKMGDLTTPSAARGFIKILNPSTSFSETASVAENMAQIPFTWRRYTISIVIDPAWTGQLLQVGFDTNATNFTPSGVLYDNLLFEIPIPCIGNGTDTDGDGIDNNCDNCTLVANPAQTDYDQDGFGNICDADFNNSCLVASIDFAIFKNAFFTTFPLVDMDDSGLVNGIDLGLFRQAFFKAPGPNGIDVPDACP